MGNKRELFEGSLYLKKEERDRMGDLSLLVFGSRGKWLKLARQLGLTTEGIKVQMEAMRQHMMDLITKGTKNEG